LEKVIHVEDKASIDSPQQVGIRVWDGGELEICIECQSSLRNIVELDDEYKENHEAMTVDDDSQDV